MNENIKKFFEQVAKDTELQKKLSQFATPEEAYGFASGVQGGFTKDEFVAVMKKVLENSVQDFSEDDLAKIAGGQAIEYPKESLFCTLQNINWDFLKNKLM